MKAKILNKSYCYLVNRTDQVHCNSCGQSFDRVIELEMDFTDEYDYVKVKLCEECIAKAHEKFQEEAV